MKLDYLKDKKEIISTGLLWFSVAVGVVILVKTAEFFAGNVKAATLLKQVAEQGAYDPNETDTKKYLAESKQIAETLKKKNLFIPPEPKKHPVSQVLGILGDEVLINGKWYKEGDKVGDAKIVRIEPTFVKIRWDGKEKEFAPISAGESSQPDDANRQGRPGEKKENEKSQNQDRPERRGRGEFRMSPEGRDRIRERMQNMTEEERQQYRERMRSERGGGGGRGRGRRND